MWLRRTPAPEDAEHAGTPGWADLNEEERAEDNRRRAAARAKKAARLYAVANGLRFMWVLTWPDEVLLHGQTATGRPCALSASWSAASGTGTGSPSPTSTAPRSTRHAAAGT